jgi:hypothetical protein
LRKLPAVFGYISVIIDNNIVKDCKGFVHNGLQRKHFCFRLFLGVSEQAKYAYHNEKLSKKQVF